MHPAFRVSERGDSGDWHAWVSHRSKLLRGGTNGPAWAKWTPSALKKASKERPCLYKFYLVFYIWIFNGLCCCECLSIGLLNLSFPIKWLHFIFPSFLLLRRLAYWPWGQVPWTNCWRLHCRRLHLSTHGQTRPQSKECRFFTFPNNRGVFQQMWYNALA